MRHHRITIIMFPLKPYFYIELAAFITSIIFFKYLKGSRWQWLPFFLLLMLFTELAGRYMRKVLSIPNTPLFNITIPLEYLFYAFLFYSFIQYKTFKTCAAIIFWAIFLFAVVNISFFQSFYLLTTNTLKFGSICMIFISGLTLIDLLTSDFKFPIYKIPLFWIAIGVLIFNVGEFIYLSIFNLLLKYDWDKAATLFANINNKLIYVLYGSIIICILCMKNFQKRVS
jgi:hypothetical protein